CDEVAQGVGHRHLHGGEARHGAPPAAAHSRPRRRTGPRRAALLLRCNRVPGRRPLASAAGRLPLRHHRPQPPPAPGLSGPEPRDAPEQPRQPLNALANPYANKRPTLFGAPDFTDPGSLTIPAGLFVSASESLRYGCWHDNGDQLPVRVGCEETTGVAPGTVGAPATRCTPACIDCTPACACVPPNLVPGPPVA